MASFDDGTLHIDFDGHKVTLDGEPLDLDPREFAVLAAFARQRNQVVSADELTVAADITGPFAPPMPPEVEAVLGVQSKLLIAGAFSEGDIVDLDIEQHEVTWQGRPLPVELDPNEFDLLVDLAGQRTRWSSDRGGLRSRQGGPAHLAILYRRDFRREGTRANHPTPDV